MNMSSKSIFRNKYMSSKSLTQIKAKPNVSHFWRELVKVKDEVLTYGTFNVIMGPKRDFRKIHGRTETI